MSKRYGFSESIAMQVYSKTGGKCFYCDEKLINEDMLDWGGKVVSTVRRWHVDHSLPLSRGGDNSIDNLLPACISCNSIKRARTADEFIQQEQAYLQLRRA